MRAAGGGRGRAAAHQRPQSRTSIAHQRPTATASTAASYQLLALVASQQVPPAAASRDDDVVNDAEHAECDENTQLSDWPARQAGCGALEHRHRLPAVRCLKAQRRTGGVERWLTARPPSGRCRGTSRGGSRERGRRHAAGEQRGAVTAEAKMSADSLAIGGDVCEALQKICVRPRAVLSFI